MTARFRLFLIWFGGFLACLVLLFYFLLSGDMLIENLVPDLSVLVGVFAPYLTTILGFWFARRAVIDGQHAYSPDSFRIAAVCSLLFQMAILALLFSAIFRKGEGVIESAIGQAASVSSLLAFLVGPAIGFFFGKPK